MSSCICQMYTYVHLKIKSTIQKYNFYFVCGKSIHKNLSCVHN